jgi:ABC-2 type transport system permease protein
MAIYRNRPVPEYNTDYVSFLITGILIANVVLPMARSLESGASPFNPWMLESVLMTGIRTPILIIGSILWNLILSFILFIPQILIGVYIFNAQLNVNLISTILSVIISMVMLFSLSMIAVGTRIVTKSKDPISGAISMASQLFAGMLFPVQFLNQLLPGLSNVAWILPPTWIYHLIRRSMLNNASLLDSSFLFDALMGSMIALILLPVGLYTFRWGLRRSKKEGTLGWF